MKANLVNLMTTVLLLLAMASPSKTVAVPPATEPTGDRDDRSGQWATSAVEAPRVRYCTFESAAAKATVSFHVYLPALYNSSPDRRFPVLYWLHGSGGALQGIKPVSALFDAAIERGDIPPLIIVFPNGLPFGMWCDSKDGTAPIETMIVRELIPHVDRTFRTAASREGRILEGFSMGGYGAGRLGLRYPKLFTAVSMLGAGPLQLDFLQAPKRGSPVSPENRRKIYQRVYGSDAEYFRAQSPWVIAEQNAQAIQEAHVRIRQVVGEDDFTLPANRELTAHLSKLGIEHEYVCPPGVGHDALGLFKSMGAQNWLFYRRALGAGD